MQGTDIINKLYPKDFPSRLLKNWAEIEATANKLARLLSPIAKEESQRINELIMEMAKDGAGLPAISEAIEVQFGVYVSADSVRDRLNRRKPKTTAGDVEPTTSTVSGLDGAQITPTQEPIATAKHGEENLKETIDETILRMSKEGKKAPEISRYLASIGEAMPEGKVRTKLAVLKAKGA